MKIPRKMGDKPAKVSPFPSRNEIKSLRSEQKTSKLSHTNATQYISTNATQYISTNATQYISTNATQYISTNATQYISTIRKFRHLFNISVLVLFKKYHGFLKYCYRKFYIIRIPQTIRLRYETNCFNLCDNNF